MRLENVVGCDVLSDLLSWNFWKHSNGLNFGPKSLYNFDQPLGFFRKGLWFWQQNVPFGPHLMTSGRWIYSSLLRQMLRTLSKKKNSADFVVLVKWFDDVHHKGKPQDSWTRQFVVALTNVKLKKCKSHKRKTAWLHVCTSIS